MAKVESATYVQRRNTEAQKDDEARTREEALKARHAKQMRRLSENHRKELEKLKSVHDTMLEQQRSRMRETLSKRDQDYQKEMAKVRRTYRDTLRNTVNKYESTVENIRETKDNEIKSQDQRTRIQREKIKAHNQEERSRSKRLMDQTREDMQKAQAEALAKQRALLLASHAQKEANMKSERDSKVDNLASELGRVSREKREFEKASKAKLARQKQLQSQRLMDQVIREREVASETVRNQQQEFGREVERVRNRFGKEMKKRNEQRYKTQEYLNTEVAGRVQDRLIELKKKIADERAKHQLEMVSEHRLQSMEKENIRDSYTRNIEQLEKVRSDTVKKANAEKAKDIIEVSKKNDEALNKQEAFYKGKVNLLELRHDDHVAKTLGVLETRNHNLQQNAREREATLLRESEKRLKSVQDYYTEMLKSTKDLAAQEKLELREFYNREKNELENRLMAKLREREALFNEKLATVMEKHAIEVQELKRGHQSSNHEKDRESKRVLRDVKNNLETEMKRKESVLTSRMEQLELKHKQEIDRINRRNAMEKERLARGIS
jgi:hypothetical protein